MNEFGCERESEVLNAVSSAEFSDELRIHAMECPHCTEVVLVAGLMNRDAAQLENIGPVPDAGYMWWRAHLKEREARSRRATSLITLIQRVALVAGALVTVGILRTLFPTLSSWVSTLKSSAAVFSLPDSAASPALVILVCLGLLAAPKVFDLYGGWTGD